MRRLRIASVFDYGLAYCRDILHEVKRYSQAKPEWVFATLAPGLAAARTLQEVGCAGVIAHLYSDAAVDQTAPGRPAPM